MKKILLAALVAILAISASAENWYVGGAFGYSHAEYDGNKADQFNIAPELGYNLSDTWAVGGILSYSWVKDSHNAFSIEPYARWTFLSSSNDLVQLFVDGGLGIGVTSPDEGDSETIWKIGLTPGLKINLTNKFSLVAHVGFFGFGDYKSAGGKQGGFNVDGSNLKFGFYYNF